MKFNLSTCILGLFMVFCATAVGQNSTRKASVMQKLYAENTITPFTAQEMQFLQEVYGEHLQEEILSKPTRVKDIKHLLRNRIQYFEEPNPNNHKDYVLLSSVPLFNVFVEDLKRDEVFSDSFNPLKYQIEYFSKGSKLFRIDNTNTFILIRSQTGR